MTPDELPPALRDTVGRAIHVSTTRISQALAHGEGAPDYRRFGEAIAQALWLAAVEGYQAGLAQGEENRRAAEDLAVLRRAAAILRGEGGR